MKKKTIDLSVKEGYERWSKTYDKDKNILIAIEERPLLDSIGQARNKTILDAGCGTGRISLKLLNKGAKVFGIDVSPYMIKKAETKVSKYPKYKGKSEFKLASVYKIPYNDCKFDLVVCNLVICHLKNLNKAVSEMSRVLKKSGTLIISDLHPYVLKHSKGTIFVQDKKIFRIKNYFYSLGVLRPIFKKNNLKVIEIIEPKISKKKKGTLIRMAKEYKEDPKRVCEGLIGNPIALIIKLKKEKSL
jgi:malonyl-CoA O-methyltransferase